MMNWDRHEIDTRTKMLEVLTAYQLRDPYLVPSVEEGQKLLTYQPDALHAITEELYVILKEEMLKHEQRWRTD